MNPDPKQENNSDYKHSRNTVQPTAILTDHSTSLLETTLAVAYI